MFVALISLFFPFLAYAETNYGDGRYGIGEYNVGEVTSTSNLNNSSSGTSSENSASACFDQAPGTQASWLYGAIANSGTSITLYFTEASEPVTKYVLEYGTSSGEYQFGVTDMGVNERHQMTYTVKALSSGTNYYFRIRSDNGCATGPWSNEISAISKDGFSLTSLDLTYTEIGIEEQPEEEQLVPETCQIYTVNSGDTLWGISQRLLGEGYKFKEIIKENEGTYPSLSTSSSISEGWELKVGCTPEIVNANKQITEEAKAYDVNVKVVDKADKPVAGAKVTLHSDPKEAVTNDDGTAHFVGVEGGEHKVLISYKSYEGEQSIYLSGDDTTKTFNVTVTIEMKNALLSPTVLVIVGGLVIVIGVLVVFLVKSNRQAINKDG